MTDFKRDKEIPSTTYHIDTSCCGTLHLTLGKQDDRLIEVRAVIGKSGICCNVLLESVCKVMSMLLQTDTPRYKIIKKFNKQFNTTEKFDGVNCGQGFEWQGKKYGSCIEVVSQSVVGEVAKQI